MIAHIRLIAASALLVAGLVASQLVYLWAIIPRLSGWHSISGIWYVPLIPDPHESLPKQALLKGHTEAQRHRETARFSSVSLCLCVTSSDPGYNHCSCGFGIMLPAVLGFLDAGIMLRDGREFLIAATAGVFLGFGPFALTDSRPVESWPVALVNLYLVSAVCLAVSFVPRQLLRRRTAAKRAAAVDEARQH